MLRHRGSTSCAYVSLVNLWIVKLLLTYFELTYHLLGNLLILTSRQQILHHNGKNL